MPIIQIAKKLKVSTVSLYKFRARLVKDKLLNPDFSFTQAAFNLMEKGALLSKNVTSQNVTRLHNTAIVVKIARRPKFWEEQRERWMLLKGGRKWRLKSGALTEVRLSDTLRVRTTPSSVIFFFGEIYAKDPTDAKNQLFNLTLAAISLVESELKVSLYREKWNFVFRTTQQEFAFLNNGLAKEIVKSGFNLKVVDHAGRTRILVDQSLGLPELEAPNAIHGEDDARAVKSFLEDAVVWGLSLRGEHNRNESQDARIAQLEKAVFDKRVKANDERREVG